MFLQPPLSQLCGMLSFTGNFEFLAKDSLITDLKQNLLGKVSQGKKGGFHFSQVSYLVTGTSPAAQNILFSISGCPQANPVISYQLTLLSKNMFSLSGSFRRDCVPRAFRHELTEPAPLWSRSEHTRVSCLPVPHTRGEPSGIRAGGAPGVQAGGGDLPGSPLLGGGRLVGSTLGRRPHC